MGFNIIWASMRDTLALLLANNKGAYQLAHPHSLISAFVMRYLNSKVGQISKNSPFCLVGFNLITSLSTPLVNGNDSLKNHHFSDTEAGL